jgi:hypothetical protein
MGPLESLILFRLSLFHPSFGYASELRRVCCPCERASECAFGSESASLAHYWILSDEAGVISSFDVNRQLGRNVISPHAARNEVGKLSESCRLVAEVHPGRSLRSCGKCRQTKGPRCGVAQAFVPVFFYVESKATAGLTRNTGKLRMPVVQTLADARGSVA